MREGMSMLQRLLSSERISYHFPSLSSWAVDEKHKVQNGRNKNNLRQTHRWACMFWRLLAP